VLDQLDEYVAKGNKAGADELGASLAGASTAVLGMASMGDVERQLKAIRNRTTTMGVDQSVTNENMPYINAWINAEGNRSELSESESLAGYELNSWGGTVGFDVDICPTLTAGVALTAMRGDLDATGADIATGDMDTNYMSVFARYATGAWTHTFVATMGMSDISLNRTVAGVELEGKTDATSYGFMYEVGRVIALDEECTACLQPVFNVTWRSSSVDGYSEEGSDLALKVDEQSLNTVTFGLGARLQAVVGESMYNRTSILEARVMAKVDAGDRSGSSDVALAALPESRSSVDSAEMGAFGLEVGAGLTLPIGQEGGSIFADASVELRSDYTNVNGTVGYRINF
jgi:outer membrane autotransporter protein